jgi:hypothetical protein
MCRNHISAQNVDLLCLFLLTQPEHANDLQRALVTGFSHGRSLLSQIIDQNKDVFDISPARLNVFLPTLRQKNHAFIGHTATCLLPSDLIYF